MTLLDVGCGWGATAVRAAERYGANVIGLTLSRRQFATTERLGRRRGRGWRSGSRGGRRSRAGSTASSRSARSSTSAGPSTPAFFQKCRVDPARRRRDAAAHDHGGQAERGLGLPPASSTSSTPRSSPAATSRRRNWSWRGPQERLRVVHVESLRPHYARTLDCWAANLEAKRDEAIAMAGVEQYDRYMKYLTGCANLFRSGETNLHQFKLRRTDEFFFF